MPTWGGSGGERVGGLAPGLHHLRDGALAKQVREGLLKVLVQEAGMVINRRSVIAGFLFESVV
jgi:hypothetical protein